MRLVTRGCLDGLACAALIDHAERLSGVSLASPGDITDETFDVQPGDILANLPYHNGCLKWFNHHSVTRSYETPPHRFEGRYGLAPSTARLVYDYYLHDNPGFNFFDDLVNETDRFHNAQLNIEDVTDPSGYVLLGFTLDPGAGTAGYEDYFALVLDTLRDGTLEELMMREEVRERVRIVEEDRKRYLAAMRRVSRLEDRVIVSDLREAEALPVGNRFLIYTLFPEATASLRIAWGPERESVVASAGHSLFNRNCSVHVGGLMSKYGGGGHKGAGATPLDRDSANEAIQELIDKLNGSPVSASP